MESKYWLQNSYLTLSFRIETKIMFYDKRDVPRHVYIFTFPCALSQHFFTILCGLSLCFTVLHDYTNGLSALCLFHLLFKPMIFRVYTNSVLKRVVLIKPFTHLHPSSTHFHQAPKNLVHLVLKPSTLGWVEVLRWNG